MVFSANSRGAHKLTQKITNLGSPFVTEESISLLVRKHNSLLYYPLELVQKIYIDLTSLDYMLDVIFSGHSKRLEGSEFMS